MNAKLSPLLHLIFLMFMCQFLPLPLCGPFSQLYVPGLTEQGSHSSQALAGPGVCSSCFVSCHQGLNLFEPYILLLIPAPHKRCLHTLITLAYKAQRDFPCHASVYLLLLFFSPSCVSFPFVNTHMQ